MIRTIWIFAFCSLIAVGCGTYKTREKVDIYEGVRIDELRGNKVSRGILDRRTLWLNARREIRRDQTRDYYLITEITPSQDFTPQTSGESLVLLVDGTRYAFAATNSPAPYTGRAGILSALYRVPPDLLVKIANAQELRIRLKGTSSVVDELAPDSVMDNFRKWLLERFTPESQPPASAAVSAEPVRGTDLAGSKEQP